MANPEHLEILKQGVKAWNNWRFEHPDIKPDFAKHYLDSESGEYVSLRDSKFRGANFSDADFTGADLCEVDFSAADLRAANLTGTNLVHANFYKTYLDRAILKRANLGGAKFVEATLNGADFSETIIWQTTFGSNDLSSVIGLESAYHEAPSTIGIDTLYLSSGKIPEVFLRGCGVPETFITFAKSLVTNPIEFYSCFISYSHADKSFARRLHDQLQSRGIRCWLDEHRVLPGDKIFDAVDQGIRLWDKVLLCASASSLSSWWVDNEINKALVKEQRLQKEHGRRILERVVNFSTVSAMIYVRPLPLLDLVNFLDGTKSLSK